MKSATYEGNPEIYILRIRNVLDQIIIARNYESIYIRDGAEVTGGYTPPSLYTSITKIYFTSDEEKKYFEIEDKRGTAYLFNFEKLGKIRQDEAYPEAHTDKRQAFSTPDASLTIKTQPQLTDPPKPSPVSRTNYRAEKPASQPPSGLPIATMTAARRSP